MYVKRRTLNGMWKGKKPLRRKARLLSVEDREREREREMKEVKHG